VDGKKKRGISMKQGGEKLKNCFWDYEKKQVLSGFPEVDEKKAQKKTYWKVYFAEVEQFLIDRLSTLKFAASPKPKTPQITDEGYSVGEDSKLTLITNAGEAEDYPTDLPF